MGIKRIEFALFATVQTKLKKKRCQKLPNVKETTIQRILGNHNIQNYQFGNNTKIQKLLQNHNV